MNNKMVLITVADNGIGFAMPQTLLKGGYQIAALDLSTGNLESMCAAYPNQLTEYACNLSDENQSRAKVEPVIQNWEQIDIVVNNALAIFKRFDERTIEETRREFDLVFLVMSTSSPRSCRI